MGKRRTSSCELRSIPMPAQVHKYREIGTLREGASAHWGVDHIQPFFPSLELLFKTDNLDNVKEHGLKFTEGIQSVLGKKTIQTTKGETVDVHIKQSSILSPIRWMRGDYGTVVGLPTTKESAVTALDKIQSPHNAAYVGSLFAALLSQSGCIHFPKVYGVFSGIAKKHTFDISEDYEDLAERPWFSKNIGTFFQLQLADHVSQSGEFQHTRSRRIEVELGDEISLGPVAQLDGIPPPENIAMGDIRPVFEEDTSRGDDESDSSSVSTSYVFEIRSCDCSEDSDTMSVEEDEEFAWSTLSNVPVQLTVMEQCEGTLYELMCLEPETTKHVAWLTQVMFALCFAQRTFGFTHNDLHTNNIMYVKTSKEHLWYNLEGQAFKVPTYGYIIKLIDFERGVGSVRLVGMKQPKVFMSDNYAIDEDAGGQYNVEPFYSSKHESIKPNPSFDCVRMATCLFWDLFPEGPNHKEYFSNPIFNTLIRWLKQDDGTSVLFGKGDPQHERYHGFHLYKAIARYSKDSAVPRKEIVKLSDTFGVKGGHPVDFDCVIV